MSAKGKILHCCTSCGYEHETADICGFENNTTLTVLQNWAPTGWEHQRDAKYDNAAVRLTINRLEGGTNAGTVAFTSAFTSKSVSGRFSGTTGSTSLSESQMAQHRHYCDSAKPYMLYPGKGDVALLNYSTGNYRTKYAGSSYGHSHTQSGSISATVDLRVKHVVGIVIKRVTAA